MDESRSTAERHEDVADAVTAERRGGVADAATAVDTGPCVGENGAAGDSRRPTGGDPDGATGRGRTRLTAVEKWTPPSPTVRGTGPVQEYLTADESLAVVDGATLLGDGHEPATVGLTDERLLVVTADDGFVGVGFDRLCSVRSHVRTKLGVRGMDSRLLGGVGYLLAVVGFLGVLGVARNPLTPALSLATAGGVLAADYVRRDGVDTPVAEHLPASGRAGALADRLRAFERRLSRTGQAPLPLVGAASLAVLPFLGIVALEDGLAAPLFALLAVAGIGVAVYAFRHSGEFGGITVVRRRQRTVAVTVDDGTVVTVRTHPDSLLDRELAARAQTPTASGRSSEA